MPKTLRQRHEGGPCIPPAVFRIMCTAMIWIQVTVSQVTRIVDRETVAAPHVRIVGKITTPVRKLTSRGLCDMMASGSQSYWSQGQRPITYRTCGMHRAMSSVTATSDTLVMSSHRPHGKHISAFFRSVLEYLGSLVPDT